jgi:hypothetical protein
MMVHFNEVSSFNFVAKPWYFFLDDSIVFGFNWLLFVTDGTKCKITGGRIKHQKKILVRKEKRM